MSFDLEPRFSDEELRAFEVEVAAALDDATEERITVLGYGECSTVLRLDTSLGSVACKRTPCIPSRMAAESYASLVHAYVNALEARGLSVVPTEVRIVEGKRGDFVLYCVQSILPAGSLGPDHFAGLDEGAAIEASVRIFDLIKGCVGPTLAPDGQLSNWTFIDGNILYLDVGSPFMRDEQERPLLDWDHQISALPAVVRPIVRGKILHSIIGNYHSLRGQIVDFLGNLQKEKLESLAPPLLAMANEKLCFDPPLAMEEVHAYYARDARTYAVMQALRRADRWWRRHVRRDTYPYFLAPRIDRNL